MKKGLLYLLVIVAGALLTPGLAAAAPDEAEPERYNIVTMADPGGRVLLFFEVRNAGKAAWLPGHVTLTNIKNPMGASGQYGLNRSVLPNETAYWDFEVKAPTVPGVHESTWQVLRSGQAISPRLTCYIIVVPPEAKELRAKIQKLIDDFNREHGHEVSQLIRQIKDLLAREGEGLIERLLRGRCALLTGALALLGVVVRWPTAYAKSLDRGKQR